MALSFVAKKIVQQKIQLQFMLLEMDDERKRERSDEKQEERENLGIQVGVTHENIVTEYASELDMFSQLCENYKYKKFIKVFSETPTTHHQPGADPLLHQTATSVAQSHLD